MESIVRKYLVGIRGEGRKDARGKVRLREYVKQRRMERERMLGRVSKGRDDEEKEERMPEKELSGYDV